MGVRVIVSPSSTAEAWLVDVIRKHSQRAGIGMPEVGIFEITHVANGDMVTLALIQGVEHVCHLLVERNRFGGR
jgi:hypothetical protein